MDDEVSMPAQGMNIPMPSMRADDEGPMPAQRMNIHMPAERSRLFAIHAQTEEKAKRMKISASAETGMREWEDAADGNGGIVRRVGMRTVRIPDHYTWAKWRSDPCSIPAYLLRFISANKGRESDEMKLYSPTERFLAGENWITEDIDRMGAIFLSTKDGQSDLAFSVTGRHVYGFAESDEYILEDVEVRENTQYVKDFARKHLENELYPHTPAGSARSIGEMVHYEGILKSSTLCSHQISMIFYSKKGDAGGAVFNWRAVDARGKLIHIYIGCGFQTANDNGVVMEMSTDGSIVKWREMWDQHYFDSKYPCVMQAMGKHDLVETDVERIDPIRHDSILQVFEILPMALAQPQNIFGTGARFLAGVVRVASGRPIKLYGLEKFSGEDLLQCLHHQSSLTPSLNLSAFLHPLRAAIEDGLTHIGMHRIEAFRKPASLIEIVGVPGQICMAILHAFTLKSHRKATYTSNQIAVEFLEGDDAHGGSWKSLERIMLRNAHKTVIPDSGTVVAGPPKFKWMMLPYSKLVLSLKYYKLESPGGTVTHLDTSGNVSREFNSKLSDKDICSLCLRKYCVCE